jgi:hypothetical protein
LHFVAQIFAAVGLRVVLIIEDGETAIFQVLRVHIAYFQDFQKKSF